MKLALSLLRMDGGTQPRSELSADTVSQYAELMLSGVTFPPVIVFYDGESYWLSDGFHRVNAAMRTSITEIDTEVIQGTLDDAKWHSFGVNQAHGLRRTNEDKQRSVKAALQHPKSQALSDSAIAKHVGVATSTVGDWRKKLEGVSLGFLKIPDVDSRTVTRGATTYTQDVSNIGRTRSQSQSASMEVVPPLPRSMQMPAIDRQSVWACQMRKNFEKEVLRLIRAFERANPPVSGLFIKRENGTAVSIQISHIEVEVNA